MRNKKIVITGATGQVGLPLAVSLAEHNTVYAVARFNDESKRQELEQAGLAGHRRLPSGLPGSPCRSPRAPLSCRPDRQSSSTVEHSFRKAEVVGSIPTTSLNGPLRRAVSGRSQARPGGPAAQSRCSARRHRAPPPTSEGGLRKPCSRSDQVTCSRNRRAGCHSLDCLDHRRRRGGRRLRPAPARPARP